MPNKQLFLELILKHLPPSASDLQLLDVGAVAGDVLLEARSDLSIQVASLNVADWDYAVQSFDAIVAYDLLLKDDFLRAAHKLMRAGGRLIIVNPLAQLEEQLVKQLENADYVRILVEPAIGGAGVLIRGEIPHETDDTLQRVHDVALRDADLLTLDDYRGLYVHLLIQQSPNKPVWRLKRNEKIEWKAISFEEGEQASFLAFSSLPKAVNFMQEAVLNDLIRDVNKVGKFSKETAKTWDFPLVLNPRLDYIHGKALRLIEIDPQSAEVSEE